MQKSVAVDEMAAPIMSVLTEAGSLLDAGSSINE